MAGYKHDPLWDENGKQLGIATISDIENGEYDTERDMILSEPEMEQQALSDERKVKSYLTAQKKRIVQMLDAKKLALAVQTMNANEQMASLLTDPDVWERVKDNIQTPMDLKFIAEAMERNEKRIQNLTRLDTVDGSGKAGKIRLGVRFENEQTGAKMEAIIDVDDPNGR